MLEIKRRRDGPGRWAGAPLGIKQRFASTPEIIEDFSQEQKAARIVRRRNRWRQFREWLAMRQREEVCKAGFGRFFKSLFKCGRYAVPAFVKNKEGEQKATGSPGRVSLGVYADDPDYPLAYNWMQRCGNALLCFVDAPVIRYKRNQDIKAIGKRMFELGYTWLFITLTAKHDINTDPSDFVKRFQSAERFFKAGRWFQDFKRRYGLCHSIRAVEVTYHSPYAKVKNGCHWHSHKIDFFEHGHFTEEEAKAIEDEMFEHWLNALKKFGLSASRDHGVIVKCPRMPKNGKLSIDELGDYVSKGTAAEMAPGIFVKSGKLPDRINHFQLFALALTSHPDLIPAMIAIMRALKGRHWLQFSRGLVELCGLSKKIKKDDKELLAEDRAPALIQYDEKDWIKVDQYKMYFRLKAGTMARIEEWGVDFKDLKLDDKKNIDVESGPGLDAYSCAVAALDTLIMGFDPLTGEDLESYSKSPPVLPDDPEPACPPPD